MGPGFGWVTVRRHPRSLSKWMDFSHTASARLHIDRLLVLLGPFLRAVYVSTLSCVSLQCWLLDEWISSTPQTSTTTTILGTVLFSGIDRKVRESKGSRMPALGQGRLMAKTQNIPAMDELPCIQGQKGRAVLPDANRSPAPLWDSWL